MIIAVDFDGTIVEHRYPEIGKEIPFAIETLKMLQREGHRLILWSVREDKLLEEAVEFCRQRGLEFYAVNTNYPEEKSGHEHFSRKLKADVFIDDRNLGGLFDWGSIYRIIHNRIKLADLVEEALNEKLGEVEERRMEKKKKNRDCWASCSADRGPDTEKAVSLAEGPHGKQLFYVGSRRGLFHVKH